MATMTADKTATVSGLYWMAPSDSGKGEYRVTGDPKDGLPVACECPAFKWACEKGCVGYWCKHMTRAASQARPYKPYYRVRQVVPRAEAEPEPAWRRVIADLYPA